MGDCRDLEIAESRMNIGCKELIVNRYLCSPRVHVEHTVFTARFR